MQIRKRQRMARAIQVGGVKSNGHFAIVDDEDFDEVSAYAWRVHEGYAKASVDGRITPLHRLVMRAPRGLVVHHKNDFKLDCRKCNLVVCTHRENVSQPMAHLRIRHGMSYAEYRRFHEWLFDLQVEHMAGVLLFGDSFQLEHSRFKSAA